MLNHWTQEGLHDGLALRVGAMAKCNGDSAGGKTLKRKSEMVLRWMAECKDRVYLAANPMAVKVCERNLVQARKDDALKAQILGTCATLGAFQCSSPAKDSVLEKLCVNTDMRHMFLKGVLYLFDYNLAVSSLKRSRIERKVKVPVFCNPSSGERLAAAVKYDIVADAVHYTATELRLLTQMACAYPVVEYVPGSKYSNLLLAPDNLCIVADRSDVLEGGFGYGDPTEMWRVLVSIACKHGCLDDLRWAVAKLRGTAHWYDHIATVTGIIDMQMTVPLSRSIRTWLGGNCSWRDYVTHGSNYFSTTKSLVLDAMMGEAMKQSAYNAVESIGPMSPAMVPSGDVKTDECFASMMRDHGFKQSTAMENPVLANLEVTQGTSGLVEYGKAIRDLAIEYAEQMRNGYTFTYPVLNMAIGACVTTSNAWSVSRGWEALPDHGLLRNYKGLEATVERGAMLWCMGGSERIPRVGWNLCGVKTLEPIDDADDVMLLAEGTYHMTKVAYRLLDVSKCRGRIDASSISNGGGPDYGEWFGTACGLVVGDDGKVKWVVEPGDVDEKTTMGERTPLPEEEVKIPNNEPVELPVLQPPPSYQAVPKVSRAERRKEHERRMIEHFSGMPLGSVGRRSRAKEMKHGMIGIGTQTGYFTQVSGEGNQCLLNAVIEDMAIHGLVKADERDSVKRELWDSVKSEDFHDGQAVALALNRCGIGLTVLDEKEDGVRAYGYGVNNASHVVHVLRRGNHYDSWVPGKHGISTLEIKSCDGSLTPEESVGLLEPLAEFFDGRRPKTVKGLSKMFNR
jgi:hypothetical protein